MREPNCLFALALLFTANSALGAPLPQTLVPLADPLVDAVDQEDPTSAALLNAAKSSQVKLRTEAAISFGRIFDPKSVDPLLALLKDSNSRVVKEAIFGLGQLGLNANSIGTRQAEILGEIQPFLKHVSPAIRVLAFEAVGKIAHSDVAPAILLPGLKDLFASVRASAALALFRTRYASYIRGGGEQQVPLSDADFAQFSSISKDPSARVREAFAFYFHSFKEARALPILIELANDNDCRVQINAVKGLESIADPAAYPVLTSLLSSPSKDLRYQALSSIKSINSKAWILTEPVAHTAANDSYYPVRKLIATILATAKASAKAPTDQTWANSELISLANDSILDVAAAAKLSIATLNGAQDANPFQALSKAADWQTRAAAVNAVSALTDANSIEILYEAASDADLRVRSPALQVVGGFDGDRAWAIVQQAMKSSVWGDVLSVIGFVGSRKEPIQDQVALLAYVYQAQLPNPNPGLRENAAQTLAGIKDASATAVLQTMVNDSDAWIANLVTTELTARGVYSGAIPVAGLTFSPFRNLTFNENPRVIFKTQKGEIEMEGFAKEAPLHVANFVGMAQAGEFNGTDFHRLVPNFVAQGGYTDTLGIPMESYNLRAEINHIPFVRGMVGMPRSSSFDSGDGEVFIMQVADPELDGLYTVYARVVRGMDVVDSLEPGDLILSTEVHF